MQISEYEALKSMPEGTVLFSSSVQRHPNDKFAVPFQIVIERGMFIGRVTVPGNHRYCNGHLYPEQFTWEYPNWIGNSYQECGHCVKMVFFTYGIKNNSQLNLFGNEPDILESSEEITTRTIQAAMKVYEVDEYYRVGHSKGW